MFKKVFEIIRLSENAYKFTKWSVFIICSGLFTLQVYIFFDLYMKNATILGVTYEETPFKFYPSVTLCPEEMFRDDSLPLTQKDLERVAFRTDELLFENKQLKNGEWKLTETIGPYVGKCLTISNLNVTTPFNISYGLYLSKKHNMRLHCHNPGEEFWFFLEIYPVEMPKNLLHTKDETLTYFDIRIKDTIIMSKSTSKRLCSEKGTSNDYVKCIKLKFIQKMNENLTLNCTSVFIELIHKWNLPPCKTSEEAMEAFYVLQKVFYDLMRSPRESGCYLPCNLTVYSVTLTEGRLKHLGSISPPAGHVLATLFYESLTTETRTETLLVDLGALVSAVGGNLGLFLGFSCFATLSQILEIIFKKDSVGGSLPSTASSSRLPSIESGETHSMFAQRQCQKENIFNSSCGNISQSELHLVHITWQNVISDSSNICLCFFQQIKKMKRVRKSGSKKAKEIRSLSTAGICEPFDSNSLLTGTKNNDQIYYALRLSCCIDRLIFQLGVQDFYIKNSFDSYHSSLDERGELLEFLNLRNLGPEELNDLVVLFVDTLKLVMTYSSLIEWNENVQRAWIKLIEILMIELKDRCD